MAPNGMTVGESAAHDHVLTTITEDKNPNPIVRIDVTGGNISGAVLSNLAGWSTTSKEYLTSKATGGNKRHNNVSPCIAAYVWKRKA